MASSASPRERPGFGEGAGEEEGDTLGVALGDGGALVRAAVQRDDDLQLGVVLFTDRGQAGVEHTFFIMRRQDHRDLGPAAVGRCHADGVGDVGEVFLCHHHPHNHQRPAHREGRHGKDQSPGGVFKKRHR